MASAPASKNKNLFRNTPTQKKRQKKVHLPRLEPATLLQKKGRFDLEIGTRPYEALAWVGMLSLYSEGRYPRVLFTLKPNPLDHVVLRRIRKTLYI